MIASQSREMTLNNANNNQSTVNQTQTGCQTQELNLTTQCKNQDWYVGKAEKKFS
jgi:hypothetical protein